MSRWTKYFIRVSVVFLLFLIPQRIESPYIMHLLIMSCIYSILGLAFAMIFHTGLITLGSAAYYAVGAYSSALLVVKGGFSFWLALPLAIVITAIIALCIGAVIVRAGGVPFVFLTMITGLIIVQITGQVDFFGSWDGILAIPRPDSISLGAFYKIEFRTKLPFYYLILSIMVIIMIFFHSLYKSRIGRAWKGLKQNLNVAEAIGINAYRYRLSAFVISSSATGAAGSFYAHYYQAISPETFGGWPSIYIQLYPVLGGIEYYILGSPAGALFMAFLPEILRIAEEFEPFITGTLLISVILFFPGGIIGGFEKIFLLFKRLLNDLATR